MKAYPENTDLSFEVTPVDADGKAYEDECSLKYELTGVDGKNVCSGELGAKPFKIDIEARFNVIGDDKATDIRFLKVGFYRFWPQRFLGWNMRRRRTTPSGSTL